MRHSNVGYNFKNHLLEYKLTYILVIMLFVTAVCFGTYAAGTIDESNYDELSKYIDRFLVVDKDFSKINNSEIFLYSIIGHLKIVFFMWLFSVTFLGVPVSIIIVLFKGFSLGFTAGFIINYLSLQGISFIFFTILPKSIIEIPALIMLSVICINYSITLSLTNIKKRNLKNKSYLLEHSLKIVLILLIFSLASIIEAYFSPIFLGFFVK